MQSEFIISAGIDIGTSTTKLVFSELEIENTAGYGVAPRIEITNKRILYRSPIYRTPLLDEETINMAAIHRLILKEYEAANLTPAQIQTGAILITGETATKRNASEVIHTLSNEAGDFLVATAGADLEGILAAKGSGAYEYSGTNPFATIANIDIGGGTANIAVMKNKQLLGTCTLHIGGRLLEFGEQTIHHITPPIKRWMQVSSVQLTKQTERVSAEIQYLLNDMVATMSQAVKGNISPDNPLLLGHIPNWLDKVDTLMFSGGVAKFLHEAEEDRCDDLGGLIAQAIGKSSLFRDFTIVAPMETVSATVIGTSTQTTDISGATICVSKQDLPIKNCPIVTVDFRNRLDDLELTIIEALHNADKLYRLKEDSTTIAWFMKNISRVSFRDIERLAQSFCDGLQHYGVAELPCVFIFQQDYGRVFGQTFLRINPTASILSIDQISVEQGDYIDVGGILEAGVVPVVIKTLAFHGK